jgi:hypothetical protein
METSWNTASWSCLLIGWVGVTGLWGQYLRVSQAFINKSVMWRLELIVIWILLTLLFCLMLNSKGMNTNTCSNPIGCNYMGSIILNSNTKTFEWLKAPLEVSICMLGSDVKNWYMIIELTIVRLIFLWCFVWCNNPRVNLEIYKHWNWLIECQEALTG